MANALRLVEELINRQSEDDFEEAMALYEQIAAQVGPEQQDVLSQLARSLRLDIPEPEEAPVEEVERGPVLGDTSYPGIDGGGQSAMDAFLDYQHYFGRATPEQLQELAESPNPNQLAEQLYGEEPEQEEIDLQAIIDTIMNEQAQVAAPPRSGSGSTTASEEQTVAPRPAGFREEPETDEPENPTRGVIQRTAQTVIDALPNLDENIARIVDQVASIEDPTAAPAQAVRQYVQDILSDDPDAQTVLDRVVDDIQIHTAGESVDNRRRRQAPEEEHTVEQPRTALETAEDILRIDQTAAPNPIRRGGSERTDAPMADRVREEINERLDDFVPISQMIEEAPASIEQMTTRLTDTIDEVTGREDYLGSFVSPQEMLEQAPASIEAMLERGSQAVDEVTGIDNYFDSFVSLEEYGQNFRDAADRITGIDNYFDQFVPLDEYLENFSDGLDRLTGIENYTDQFVSLEEYGQSFAEAYDVVVGSEAFQQAQQYGAEALDSIRSFSSDVAEAVGGILPERTAASNPTRRVGERVTTSELLPRPAGVEMVGDWLTGVTESLSEEADGPGDSRRRRQAPDADRPEVDEVQGVPNPERRSAPSRERTASDIVTISSDGRNEPRTAIAVVENGLTGLSTEQLQELGTTEAEETLLARERIRNLTFLEALQDPEAQDRIWRTAVAGFGRSAIELYHLPTVLQALYGTEPNMENLDQYFTDINAFNETVRVSDPLNVTESVAENIGAFLVPGGMAIRLGSFAASFGIDQAVRELTDTEVDDYQTVLDLAGVTRDQIDPTMPIEYALPGMVAVSLFAPGLTGAALGRLRNTTRVTRPRLLTDLDVNAPEGIYSYETGSNLLGAQVVDTASTLGDLYEVQGGVNAPSMRELIDVNTHAGGATRVQEGVRTGVVRFSAGNDFEAPVAPAQLRADAQRLPANQYRDVMDYILLGDMTDDMRIAIREGIGDRVQNQTNLANATAQRQAILQRTPIVQDFAQRYSSVTQAALEVSRTELMTPKAIQKLQQDRRNYVPVEMADVDANASLGRRMQQAEQNASTPRADDWFLRRRNSTGGYDMTRRVDPFTMLERYTEAMLRTRMKNDTQLAYIRGVTGSNISQRSIRKIQKGEKGKYPTREIEVYEKGKKVTYLSSQLQADLLRFDPHVAKHPVLHSINRMAQSTITGPLSGFFALTTAIRDMTLGKVLRPRGVRTGGPIAVTKAVGMQLISRAQLAIATGIRSRLATNSLLARIFPGKALDKIADSLADAHAKSLYALANKAGGFDASLNHHNIELSVGFMQNFIDTISTQGRRSPLINNGLSRFSTGTLTTFARGFIAIFNSVQNAPQFAAVTKQVKRGATPEQAVRDARLIAGDVTRSGQVYRADGSRIGVDNIRDFDLSTAMNSIGFPAALQFTRESAMFFNPMVQGTRRLINSFIEDPVGTQLRAWMYVGMPAFIAYTWNEMLGNEYNDYAVMRRSQTDGVMSIYVGLPDRPPEEGIEIPLPHEMIAFAAPFVRALYGLSRGENTEETQRALINMAGTITRNSFEIGAPTAVIAAGSAVGVAGVDGLMSANAYTIREDNIGVLDQNMENVVRDLWGVVGATALEGAFAVQVSDGDFGKFVEQVTTEYLRRAPIAHNLMGLQEPGSPYYSEPGQYNMAKTDALNRFRIVYDQHFNPDRFNPDGTRNFLQNGFMRNRFDEEYVDMPNAFLGPSLVPVPDNPLIERFGAEVREYLQTNAETGITGIEQRIRNYNKALREMRAYTVGHDAQYENFLEDLSEEEASPVLELLQAHDIDPSNHAGRVRAMHLIANEMTHLFRAQQDIYERIEAQFTERLRAEGTIGPDDHFRIEEHLDPNWTP